ncbi:MAG: hypothetical protein M1814_004328 [Vezdaea aestivalis]|nr:MAG: hypothetical protein M1814_004328 [Vezdaea aestivalis]
MPFFSILAALPGLSLARRYQNLSEEVTRGLERVGQIRQGVQTACNRVKEACQNVVSSQADASESWTKRISSDPILFTTLALLIVFIRVAFIFLRNSLALRPRGCRQIGLCGKTNLHDEFNPGYAEGRSADEISQESPKWRVKSLWIYPIKSCRGVELKDSRTSRTGLDWDRQFIFAELNNTWVQKQKDRSRDLGENIPKWRFMTQRQYPLMSQVQTELWLPNSEDAGPDPKDAGGYLVVKYPVSAHSIQTVLAFLRGGRVENSFRVPLDPTASLISKNQYPLVSTKIWKDSPDALDMSIHLPADCVRSFAKGDKEVKLLRVVTGRERHVMRAAPRADVLGRQPLVGFADANPIHMQNLASIRAVEARQPGGLPKLTALRFRPNIIITGPKAFDEDYFTRIRIGTMEYIIYSRCARCKLPNVDPNTGCVHKTEPNTTLRSFRAIDPGAGPAACLGMDMLTADSEGWIRVGDEIELLDTGDFHYVPQ